MAGLTVTAWAVGAPAPVADEAAAAIKAERMDVVLKAIREAEDPGTSISAYAAGCAVDRTNVALHTEHLRQMLRFGQVRLARFPARALARLDGEHGLALGVLGYLAARDGRMADALSLSIRAAAATEDNAGILNNLGQLTAWYDLSLVLPAIPHADRRTLERDKEKLSAREPFARGYRRIRGSAKEQGELQEAIDKKISAAQTVEQAAQQAVTEQATVVRQVTSEIDRRKDAIDDIWRDYNRAFLLPQFQNSNVVITYGPQLYYRRYYFLYQEDLLVQIGRQEREIDALQREYAARAGDLDGARVRLAGSRGAMRALRQQAAKIARRVQSTFRWDPPAVDGTIFPEVHHPPRAGKRLKLPRDIEQEATQQLGLAKLFLQNSRPKKTRDLLVGIVGDYGKTRAAQEAREILKNLSFEED